MFGGILQFFMAGWWVKKKSPIIPRNKTGQIDLTASNLKKKSVAHRLHTLKKKGTIIEDFSLPGPNVTIYVLNIACSIVQKIHLIGAECPFAKTPMIYAGLVILGVLQEILQMCMSRVTPDHRGGFHDAEITIPGLLASSSCWEVESEL